MVFSWVPGPGFQIVECLVSINPRVSNFVDVQTTTGCASLRIAKIKRGSGASPTRTADIHQNQPFLSSNHLSIDSSLKRTKKQHPSAQQLIQLLLASFASTTQNKQNQNGEGARTRPGRPKRLHGTVPWVLGRQGPGSLRSEIQVFYIGGFQKDTNILGNS